MSVNILIIEKTDKPHEFIEEKLNAEKYTTKVVNLDENAFSYFEELLPHIVIMDFEDTAAAASLTEKISEFDYTSCVFAFVPNVTNEIKKIAFAAGVRALIQSDELTKGTQDINEIINTITSACNELDHDKCNKCWEKGTYTELMVNV